MKPIMGISVIISWIVMCCAIFGEVPAKKEQSKESKVMNAAAALAIKRDNVALLKELKNCGWNPKTRLVNDVNFPHGNDIPLHWAVSYQSVESTKWLIEQGADVLKLDENNSYAMTFVAAADSEKKKQILRVLQLGLSKSPNNDVNSVSHTIARVLFDNEGLKKELIFLRLHGGNLNEQQFKKIIKSHGINTIPVELMEEGEWDEGSYRHLNTKKYGVRLTINVNKIHAKKYTLSIEIKRSDFSAKTITGELHNSYGFWFVPNLVVTES